ncbi:BtrH N-terminal domain-containing protein [Aureispira anguillae]|uniref:BtrH N-terminal domain-containing protein n=1 Tax=Aureispira anguillae TaxID=2864201 RepID=A0A915YJ28_9BACT|nr:BtrH N-terminal domain-containing protein [Aureispira anguillae]BDS13980.1 BtrH N-terminal domain-containing protein [Aureispira anguillae]
MTTTEFNHIQTAHCENGVVASLLRYHGVDFMSEPLAFGLGVGLFYIHLPFLKINHGPAISFRTMPGYIFKRASRSLGIKIAHKKFKNTESAQSFLEQKVKEGVPVGCQVGVFHLAYFPKEYRFHFNAHNLIVYGKENGRYLISDPVMETVTSLSPAELEDVRFARGPLAPKGHIYYPVNVPKIGDEQLRKAMKIALKKNAWWMAQVPVGRIGSSGFKHTGKLIRKWRSKLGERQAGLYLGQIVRMQEEIGTGGGGFRFIYAAFLEQAAQQLQNERLSVLSEQITQSGDLLRASAVRMAAIYKGRNTEQQHFNEVADGFDEIAALEQAAFSEIYKMKF